MIRKIMNFITKDTSGQNESKKVVVTIRLLLIFCVCYLTMNIILCNLVAENMQSLFLYGIFLVIFAGIFVMSYRCTTTATLWYFNAWMIVWIFAILHYFGWNVGVQHFLILLLVLYFFSSYQHHISKFLFAAGLCALRLFLFYLYQPRTPVWKLTGNVQSLLQILNTVTIFASISVISFIFSRNSQELEGKLVEYNSQLKLQANTDTLTGLSNRRKAMEYMNELIRNTNSGFSLCICDLDLFKKVNDTYGHDFGDLVLKKVSGIFQEEMRGSRFAARWGGEEFLLLFPECNGDQAKIYLEKIRRRIKETRIRQGDTEIGVTMTFGLAEYDFSGQLESVLREADEKLYIGKEKGRDIIIF